MQEHQTCGLCVTQENVNVMQSVESFKPDSSNSAEMPRAKNGTDGWGAAASKVWLLMRSLRTLHLRVERQSQTATQLSGWLHEATKDA